MVELWLARHAESVGNRDGSGADTPLTHEGRQQAFALGKELAGVAFDRVYCSPLARARETLTLALPGTALTIEPRLRELVTPSEHFVDISRMSPDQMKALLTKSKNEPEVETGRAFMARVRAWLDELPDEGRVLAVTHFAVIREIVRVRSSRPPPMLALGSVTILR
jgi:broad specificity phosphatase PhoE